MEAIRTVSAGRRARGRERDGILACAAKIEAEEVLSEEYKDTVASYHGVGGVRRQQDIVVDVGDGGTVASVI